LALLVSATLSYGGVNNWTRLGPDGGLANALAVDPLAPSTLWVATMSGVFKSTDSGGHWAQVWRSGSGAWAVAAHPTAAGRAFLVDRNQQVWVTNDGGSSWSLSSEGLVVEFTSGSFARQIVFRPGDASVVYLPRTDGLFQSLDGGGSWSAIGTASLGSSGGYDLVIDPASPAIMWLRVGNPGIMKSLDGGSTWNPANTGLPTRTSGTTTKVPLGSFAADPLAPASAMYVISSRDGNVYRSADGGGTWTPATTVRPSVTGSLLVTPGQGNLLYANGSDPTTTAYHLYASTDGGTTWNNVTGSLWTRIATPWAIPMDAPSTVYAALGEGLYVTTNAGTTWQPINTGLQAFDVQDLAFDPATPSTWYFHGGNLGIFKTTTGGSSFVPINGNLVNPVNGIIAVDPTDSQVIYSAGMASNFSDPGIFMKFVRSIDGGSTWLQTTNPNPAADESWLTPWGIATLPTTPTTVFVASPLEGAYKSTDGGASFSAINTGLPTYASTGNTSLCYYDALVVTGATGPSLLIGGKNMPTDNPYQTIDGGATWTITTGMPAGTSTYELAVDPTNPQIVYAGTSVGVFKSSDTGATWTAASSGLPSPVNIQGLAVDPASTQTLYAANDASPSGVFRSTDGAATWSVLNNDNGLGLTAVWSVFIDPANTNHLIAAGRGGLREMTIETTDPLGKGIPGATESAVPSLDGAGSGDGNGDSIADTTQPNVASLPTNPGTGWATFVAQSTESVTLSGVAAIVSPAPEAIPPTVTLPYGTLQLAIENETAAGCVTVTQYLQPADLTVNAYFKFGPTIGNTVPHWYPFPYDGTVGAEVFQEATRTRVVLHLCDGALGDSDLMVNGSISDPGAAVALPKGDANGDGLVNVQDVFFLINYMFAGGPVAVLGNYNGDAVVNVLDVFYLINYLFAGGPAPV